MLVFERVDAEQVSRPERREFRRAVISVGRSGERVWRLDHHLVSSQHGELRWREGSWHYRDTSRNGTWRNGQKLAAETWVGPLALGDTFGFGSPHLSWKLINVPTRPDDGHRVQTEATSSVNVAPYWPGFADLRIEIFDATGSDDDFDADHWVGFVLQRDGVGVRRCVVPDESAKQRLLVTLLARARMKLAPGGEDGWIAKKVLAKTMGYGETDPHRNVNGRIRGIEARLEGIGLCKDDATHWLESQKRGTETYFRLRAHVVLLDERPRE